MAVLARWAIALCLSLSASPAGAVFGGRDVAADSVAGRSLVAVLYKDASGLGLCTGTLLAPTIVLTAAHCTAGKRDDLRVVFATTLQNVPPDRLRGVAGVARPDPPPDAAGKPAFSRPDDIALLALDAPAPDDARLARLATTPLTGSIGVAGYGATSDLAKPNADGKRQLGFDRVLRAATLTLSDADGVFVADQSQGSGVCTGDSGGPAFDPAATPLTVTGLLIGVSNKRNATDFCRGKAWYASLPRWHDWIVEAAAQLGASLK